MFQNVTSLIRMYADDFGLRTLIQLLHRACWRKRHPLYLQKQTSQKRESMAAKGQ